MDQDRNDVHCCADCGVAGGVSLKACTSCKLVKYCNVNCQKNHWAKHKKACKRRAAKLRDEALFKDPPPKEDCPICFVPMPASLLSCMSLPDASITSVPIYDFTITNVELAKVDLELYYSCCGKSICGGCVYSSTPSPGNPYRCPFCNAETESNGSDEDDVNRMMKRVEAKDAGAMFALGNWYYNGRDGLQQDRAKGMELLTRAAELGSSKAHTFICNNYRHGGNMKKAKFHYEAAAMLGCEAARCNIGSLEGIYGNIERALKHLKIAASAGNYLAMNNLLTSFEQGQFSRAEMDSTLTAYNISCAEMRSEARDTFINVCQSFH